MNDRAVFTGYVSDEKLVHPYRGAELMIYPSFYEGFGLPILESIRCGTPVIATNTSSMPEIVGESSALFNPKRPEEIAEKICRVLTDPQMRNYILVREKENSKRFSWEKGVSVICDLLEKVKSERGAKEKGQKKSLNLN